MLKKICIFLIMIVIVVMQCNYSMAAHDIDDTTQSQTQTKEDKTDEKKDKETTSSSSSSDGELYKMPERIEEDGDVDEDKSLDEMITDAEDFITSSPDTPIDRQKLQQMSSKIYNIALEIGVGIAVIIGLVLGIRLMIAGTEEKAEYKKMLWVYVVGCIVTFGAFGIWKIVVSIVEKI